MVQNLPGFIFHSKSIRRKMYSSTERLDQACCLVGYASGLFSRKIDILKFTIHPKHNFKQDLKIKRVKINYKMISCGKFIVENFSFRLPFCAI